MAELGQTDDPKALIPGDVGAITENVLAIIGRGSSLRQTGTALKGIDTGNYWNGDGANSFRDTFEKVPPKWETAGDAFRSAATALNNFAWTLGWAQGQAAEAIRIWREAEEATRRAVDAHNSAVAHAALLSAASTTPVEVAPFVDPGVEGRARAQALLQSARTQLVSAGDEAAVSVRAATEQAPEKPLAWDRVKHWGSEFGSGARVQVLDPHQRTLLHPGGEDSAGRAGRLPVPLLNHDPQVAAAQPLETDDDEIVFQPEQH